MQVSQPRMTCWKPARLWGVPDLVRRIKETGRTGWYLRVIEEGRVASGERMKLVDRLCPNGRSPDAMTWYTAPLPIGRNGRIWPIAPIWQTVGRKC